MAKGKKGKGPPSGEGPKNPQGPKPGAKKRGGKKGGGLPAWLTVAIAAFVTLVAGLVLISIYGDKLSIKSFERIETKEISIYISNDEGTALHAVKLKIRPAETKQEVSEAVEALLNSNEAEPTVPAGTKLIGLSFKDKVAYLDFSKDIVEKHPGGSSAEIQTIYAIVNTVALNFPDIRAVQILVEGKKLKTLKEHIDISEPLTPDPKLIKG